MKLRLWTVFLFLFVIFCNCVQLFAPLNLTSPPVPVAIQRVPSLSAAVPLISLDVNCEFVLLNRVIPDVPVILYIPSFVEIHFLSELFM